MPFFPRSRSRKHRSRRHEDDGVRAVSFELESLEFVAASDEVGLLRVAGRWVAPADRALSDIVLVLTRDSETLEIPPLPDLEGAAPVASHYGEAWRGAFTLAVEMIEDPRCELVLVAGKDARAPLPRPGEEAEPEPEIEAEAEAEPPSPVMADLVSQLEEIARIDDEARESEPEPELEAEEALPEPDPGERVAEPEPQPEALETLPDPELAAMRAVGHVLPA